MDNRSSVCTASVLLLSLSLCFLPSAGAASSAALLEYECNNGTSYAANSTYQSNVRSLLATLAANASRSSFPPVGFATAVVGASPNTVWGLGLCRGDTNGTDCASCLALAPDIAFGQGDYCMGVKEVSIFYDRCLVHYSFRDFLTSPDNRLVEARDGSPDNVTRDAGRFDALVVSLVGALSDWAAFNTTTRYAVGTMVSDQGFTTASKDVVRRITGLVQCTPDQAPGPCRQCLQALVDEMPAAFNGSVGGHILRVWCNLRFEVFEFYDDSPMLQLVAPPPAPPPSSSPPESRGQTGGNGTRWRQTAATVSAIVLGVAVILLSIFIFILWRNTRTPLSYQEDDDPASLLFDLPTLRHATGNFAEENMLGHGGFGAVYKGVLPHGQQIAVKRLDKSSGQGLKELRNELMSVAKLRHNNLTMLLGVCMEGQEKLLVYEYLPNKSLDTFVFAPEIEKRLLLPWDTRYRIIYGTARGLLYLHEDSQIKIIHRDLKAGNILLDNDMNPKISDFGLARLFNSDMTSYITSQVVGTLGYMAPEYVVLGHVSFKLDVYSFGVLILEIITGKKNTEMFESAVEESTTVLSFVWDHWQKETPLEIMDPSLDCKNTETEVLKCIHLALLCVQENPADRPTMLDVLVMLHGHASSFPAPSKPAFTFAYGESSSDRDLGTKRADAVPSVNGMSISEFQPR
ncbi:hypothetical protein QYE76_065931 [Lolium multiflorum]|uniref:Uncharacterized protein n=1 Tax=Lolium multiflorum TaxID=4521 RepID=A0AAD8Q103_LOLMU|nr:hypothetical protein QYE76_018577 [Lolium multiflorum]KAK1648126.1 hypothetical protein QYE76_065931 [Lolium multiflorum]